MHRLQGQGRPRAQNGEIGFRFGRRFAERFETGKSTRSPQTVHPTMHSVAGACVPVSRGQLSPTIVSEDETRRWAHEGLQTKNQRWLPNMQTTHRPVLLPRKALPRGQVPRSILSEHQAQTQTAAIGSTGTTSRIVASSRCIYEYSIHRPIASHKQTKCCRIVCTK